MLKVTGVFIKYRRKKTGFNFDVFLLISSWVQAKKMQTHYKRILFGREFSSQDLPFQVGDQVLVQGLSKSKCFNGKIGTPKMC